MHPRRTLSENMLWSLMVVLGVHFLAVLLFLGPPDAAKRWNGVSPRPQEAWTIYPGQALDLEFILPPPGRGDEDLKLVTEFKEPVTNQGLVLKAGRESIPGDIDGDQVRYGLRTAQARAPLALANQGDLPVRLAEYHLRNYAAENPNFPRLAVLWGGWEPERAVALAWLAAVAGGGLLITLGAWLFPRPVLFWTLAAGPSLLLAAAGLGAAAGGLRPVLAWDCFWLSSGLGPLLWLLGRGLAWLRGWAGNIWSLVRFLARPRPAAFLALLVGAVLLPPILIGGPAARMPFNRGPLDHLKGYRPDYIIIGNSMAYTRISWKKLEDLMPGRRAALLRLPGSRMDVWYLMLKHYVVDSGIKPRRVFLFFRDYNLTWVRHDPSERWLRTLETVSPVDDPEFNQVVFGSRNPVRRKLARGLLDVFALGNWGFYWRERVKQWVTLATIPPGFERKYPQTTDKYWARKVNDRFGLAKLRPHVQEEIEDIYLTNVDFDQELPKSLLPLFIDLARRHHIPLMMVRVQCNPRPDGSVPQSPELRRYVADLKAYLAREGVDFHDFTGDPEVTPELYSGTDHIWPKYRERYTEIFHRRLKKYLQ